MKPEILIFSSSVKSWAYRYNPLCMKTLAHLTLIEMKFRRAMTVLVFSVIYSGKI